MTSMEVSNALEAVNKEYMALLKKVLGLELVIHDQAKKLEDLKLHNGYQESLIMKLRTGLHV